MNVVTEEYLRTLLKKNIPREFKINKKTIVTPSAREYLNEKNIKLIIDEMNSTEHDEIEKPKHLIPIEPSGRHVHLKREDIDILFGKDYQLTISKELSQPGQYQYKERVMLIGPKNVIKNVSILGPPRDRSQAEVSRTDALSLGVNPPLRESGNLEGAASIYISGKKGVVEIVEGLIVAKAHIHMTPNDAKNMKIKDGDRVNIRVKSDRPIIFEDVLVRVNKNYKLNMHIDYDEANACGFQSDTMGELIL